MGIYDEKILIRQFPARIAKLCLFQKWSEVPRGARVAIELQGTALVTPVRTEPQAIADPREIELPAEKLPALMNANLLVGLSPLDLAAEGNLEFLTYWEGSSSPQHSHVIQIGKLTEEEALKIGIR